MAKIVECIPNFSEGRNQAVIDGLVEVAKSVPGVTLLDHSSDASHNRSVFTLVGDDQNIQEVAFRLVKYASENIDLTKHQGEHPRMGATDVLPFVPRGCCADRERLAAGLAREAGGQHPSGAQPGGARSSAAEGAARACRSGGSRVADGRCALAAVWI